MFENIIDLNTCNIDKVSRDIRTCLSEIKTNISSISLKIYYMCSQEILELSISLIFASILVSKLCFNQNKRYE